MKNFPRNRTWLVLVALLFHPGAQAAGDGKPAGLLACDWTFAITPLRVPGPNQVRYNIGDSNAGYWQAPYSAFYPLGTEIKLSGQYPAARNMSIQVSNTVIGALTNIGAITDYQIVPDAGSVNPFVSVNVVDPAIPAGGAYSVYVHFGTAPADPKPNTIYLDPAQYLWTGGIVLVYRIYGPFNGKLADTGQVPLPALAMIDAQGERPIAAVHTPARCAAWTAAEAVVMQGISDTGRVLQRQPVDPRPIPAQPVPPPPHFVLWGGDDKLGQLKITQWSLNADTSYVYTWLDQRAGDLVLIRALMPTHSTQPGVGPDPQLRYWSLCETAIFFSASYGCIEDSQAVIDDSGYFNAVISIPLKRPAAADAAHGYNWMDFGNAQPGTPIFRYLNPSPLFAESPSNFNPAVDSHLSQVMGAYYPLATYCSKKIFDAHTQSGDTPAQVFAACAAGI